jgi:hypothetical protein
MFNKRSGLIALLVCFAAGELCAGTIADYAVGDVLICFRGPGANDLVVDAGPVSTFTNATPNQRITVAQYTGSQLALVGTNAISWSAFTWFDDTVSPVSAQWTLFISKARASLNTQSSPWKASTSASQMNVGGIMSEIQLGALDNIAYNPVNTATAVIEPNITDANYTDGESYNDALGTDNNFGDTFQGDPENTTLSHFTTSGMVVRSDFYQLTPTSSPYANVPGTFLGYFEFNTNGVMTYVAYPSVAVVAPTIISIVRTGTTNTITFTTGPTGTYTLCGTNNLAVARTNWPAISAISGNSGQRSLTDMDNNGSKFYIITAQ